MIKKTKAVKESCGCAWDDETMRTHRKTIGFVKLSSMAFILFLITVWPAAMNFVHGVHWGIWLALTILFAIVTMKMMCCRKK